MAGANTGFESQSSKSYIKDHYFHYPASGTPDAGLKVGSPIIKLSEVGGNGSVVGQYDYDAYYTQIAGGVSELLPMREERLVFSYTVDITEGAVASLDSPIIDGRNVITQTDLTAGDQVLTANAGNYYFSYARLKLLGNESLRSNAWAGVEDATVDIGGGQTLDADTITDSRYRQDYLGWFRIDGSDPDTTDETLPQEIVANRGGIRLDRLDQIARFKMIANTNGFDAASKPHRLAVFLYVGRIPNF